MRRKIHIATATAVVVVAAALVASNIHPDFKFGWGENIGWLNWRDADGGASGVVVHETFLSGFIWAENVGWINVGDGTPADGTHYANTDGVDCGVNIDTSGDLFGLGWGENIGWINFDTASLGADRARYDPASMAFAGFAWGENVGWINLGGLASFEDCNSNDWPDDFDIADGISIDLNTNDIPDECEAVATIYVDDDAGPGGDGTSWNTAFKYVQDALAAATADGTAIRVAQGTYLPDQDEGGNVTPGLRTETFALPNDVALYGGYAGLSNPSLPNERNFSLYVSTLSGDIGTQDDSSDNSHHVVTTSGTDCTPVLHGFTITAGNANGYAPDNSGGGMYNADFSAPVLLDCEFTGNAATWGGGLYNACNNDPVLVRCVFTGNTASAAGGGMVNYQASCPTLTDCTFSGNEGAYHSGGMYNTWSSPILTNCTFDANRITQFSATDPCGGGGMFNHQFSYPVLTACVFRGNVAKKAGGGVYNLGDHSDPTLLNCIFSANIAGESGQYGYGGGMYSNRRCFPIAVNCTFAGNSASDGGRASACDNTYGSGYESLAELVNCILWDGGDEVWNAGDSDATITYSDVQNSYPGDGNIDEDPLFADPVSGDFHLTVGSPCVNAGNDAAPGLPPHDFEGDDRIQHCRVDMGADETSFLSADCNNNGTDDLCDIVFGTSLDCNYNNVPDECDVTGGTSQDQNGNNVPDECEVVNLTQGTAHTTIPDAIAQAVHGDELLAAAERFVWDTNIDFDEKAITLRSRDAISQPAGGSIIVADESALEAAAGKDITLAGSLIVEFGDRADISADELAVTGAGSLTVSAASVVDVAAPTGAALGGTAQVNPSAALGFIGPLANSSGLELYGGTIAAGGLTNQSPNGSLTGYGDLMTDVVNDDEVTIIADTQVVGDYVNNGTTTVQNGTLTITGALTNNGTIIGDTSGGFRHAGLPRSAGDGLTILGDYVAGADAALWMVSSDLTLKIGGDFDVAVNDPARFDLTNAVLQMIGLPDDGPQDLEVMAEDVGLDVTLPDPLLFSAKELRVGPTATTVNLVDLHDNAPGAGGEALYVEDLVLEPGITLDVAGLPVYYTTVTPADPSDPGSGVTIVDSIGGGGLIPIDVTDTCPYTCGDLDGNGGPVDLNDFATFALCFGVAGPTADCEAEAFVCSDLDGSGTVDLADFATFALWFGLGSSQYPPDCEP